MTITLYKSQVEDLELMRKAKAYALYHEVGAGKTFPAIVRSLECQQAMGGDPIIVFTETSLLHQLREDYHTVIGNPDEVDVAILSGKVKPAQRRIIMARKPDVVIINYEYAQRLADWLDSITPSVVWCDEGHRLKGYRGPRSKYGKRAKVIMKVAHRAPFRILTTGSPIVSPDNPDVWALYYFLDPKVFGPTLWKFEQEFFYNVVQGQPFKKLLLKPHMKDEMSRRMYGGSGDRFTGSIARRLTKRDLGERYGIQFPERRPPKVYECHMSTALGKRYRELQHQALTVVEGETITRPQLLGRLMSLQQLASGFLIERDSIDPLGLVKDDSTRRVLHIDSKHKDDVLTQILGDIGNESCIIWAVFTHEIDHLERLIADVRGQRPARADGQVTGEVRAQGIADFKAGKVKTFLAHPAAAGAGLNLQVAGHAVRYSRNYKLIEWEQSRGRNHRAGKLIHQEIFDHELVTPDTTDQKVYEAIQRKQDLASSITLDWVGAK